MDVELYRFLQRIELRQEVLLGVRPPEDLRLIGYPISKKEKGKKQSKKVSVTPPLGSAPFQDEEGAE